MTKELSSIYRASLKYPWLAPLLMHQFYQYMLGGLSIASALFGAILIAEKRTPEEATDNRCIYCLTTWGSFSSDEHIIAESLGNYDTVLPKGDVCDECNHGILSRLDEALIKFEPISWLRVHFVPYTKAGKFPEANFQNFSIAKTGPRQMTIKPKDKTGEIKTVEQIGDDLYKYNITWTGKRPDWNIIGRALFKIALGMVTLKQGREYACAPKFDFARDFIHGKIDIKNNLLLRMKCQPHPLVRVMYLDSQEGTPFVVELFGLAFIFNLEETPEIVLQADLAKLNFELVSMKRQKVSKAKA